MTDQKQNKKDLTGNETISPDHYILRLFVTGASPNSIKTINNIQQICEKHIKEPYSLEIIDIYQEAAHLPTIFLHCSEDFTRRINLKAPA